MSNGVHLESWAKIEGGCPIAVQVVGTETQLRLGGRTDGLDLVLTSEALHNLLEKCTEAAQLVPAD
ncbi:hypothetical protein JOF41_004460 [Saccharothrix coeruleofusca]|uniref:hypothetical protein n=1 Tax=Saccharothrix coeruleofusca TaxID=33919 RepID=UPI001AE813D4|nr:hypothetical protein [Saccharothrix coeruleofusca]MBP2338282.1 hypothetical protein [Saccharothrix coeruleofusca]